MAAAVVDRSGLMRGCVVHRGESVVNLVVNGLLMVMVDKQWLNRQASSMVKPVKASTQSKSVVKRERF